MDEPTMIESAMPRRLVFLVTALMPLVALACFSVFDGDGENDAPPQGWWQERGPVVPHDSFPADCSLCHEGDDWRTIRDDFVFDHGAETGHVLEGAHAAAECLRCHNDRGPVEVFEARGCAGCHEDVHRGQLGQDCTSCHGQTSWFPKPEIAQHERTRFPLVGAHAAVSCWRCHPGSQVGEFTRVDTECVSCHGADLLVATDPDHVSAGFVDSCDRCHVPTTWTGPGFNHPGFPLTGAHAGLDCSDCHMGGVFTGTPSDCFSCHMDDYDGATDPNHVMLGISTECQECHSTTTWEGASFNHAGIVSGCDACHLADWQATTSPNHMSVGFPTSCEDCHGTNTWFGATFTHSFPINSGPHSIFSCTDCHTTPGDTSAFSCTVCHGQATMDDKHGEVGGYVWSSPSCLACHPNGTH